MSAPPIAERHLHHFHRRSPIKEPVRVASTANGTLASAFENGDTIDGVVLATGDRILLKDQSTASQNGIHTVNASGAPTRAYDQSTDDPAYGFLVLVLEGTANAGKVFRNTNTAAPTIGSTSIAFAAATGSTVAALDDLSDVVIASPAAGERLRYSGSTWVNSSLHWQVLFDGTGSAILAGTGDPIETEVL